MRPGLPGYYLNQTLPADTRTIETLSDLYLFFFLLIILILIITRVSKHRKTPGEETEIHVTHL